MLSEKPLVIIDRDCISHGIDRVDIGSLASRFTRYEMVLIDRADEVDALIARGTSDPGRSFFLGNHPEVVEHAVDLGFYGLYVLNGPGGCRLKGLHADIPVFHFLKDAADWILRDENPLETMKREIHRGAETLKAGGVVAFPTETVYGLGADSFNPEAVKKIFKLKGRPLFNPLISHISNLEQVHSLASHVSSRAEKLMEAFWPGPLTLVFPKRVEVPDITTGGNPTVAVRMPKHPMALALIEAAGTAVAAPSANAFGRTSPTTALHVKEQLGTDGFDLIDGGASRVGVESTVLSLTDEVPVLLRPGGITREEIESVIGPIKVMKEEENPVLKNAPLESPGLLASHYAPKTPLKIVDPMPLNNENPRIGLILPDKGEWRSSGPVEHLSAAGDLHEAAMNLYAALRRLDEKNLDEIWAPKFINDGVGQALNDRLSKAAYKKPE